MKTGKISFFVTDGDLLTLTGFGEETHEYVRANLSIVESILNEHRSLSAWYREERPCNQAICLGNL